MKYKKEKYISQVETKKGWAFRVKVRLSGYSVDKTFHEKDYTSAKVAYDEAKKYRNLVLSNPQPIRSTTKSVSECLDESFTLYPLRLKTVKRLTLLANKYIPILNMPISKVSATDIQMSLNNMIEIASDDTIQRVLSIWRRIYQTALVNDYIYKDETLKVVAPKSHYIRSKKSFTTNRQTLDQVINILLHQEKANKFDNYIISTALITMYYTGMRPCECFALTKNDIDFSNGLITINKELGSSLDKVLTIRPCKTELSNRDIPITTELNDILKDLFTKQPRQTLFTNHKGQYFDTSIVGNKLRALCKANDIQFNMYQLRHQFSTDLITNNVDIRTVMELMGHNNSKMTVDYARSSDKLKKKALENRD